MTKKSILIFAAFLVLAAGNFNALAADLDGDNLDSAYDLNDLNIDTDDDGVFDLYDFDQNGDGFGDNQIAVDTDGDGIHDDADVNDSYPSGTPTFITSKTVGVGGTIDSLADYVNIGQEDDLTLDGGLYFVDSIYIGTGSSTAPNPTKTNVYVPPTTTELANFELAFALLEIRNFYQANLLLSDLNQDGDTAGGDDYDYEIVHYVNQVPNTPTTHDVYCLEEIAGRSAGRGIYCINYAAENNHHISIPHPEFDSGTDREGADIFWEGENRYFSMSTTHRCGIATLSACGGTTSACSCKAAECNDGDPGDPGIEPTQEFRLSDMAHAVDNFFYDFGRLVHIRNSIDLTEDIYTVQLHGCSDTSCPDNHGDGSTTSADNDPFDDDQLDGSISDNIIVRLSVGSTSNFSAGLGLAVNALQLALQTAMDTIAGGAGLGAKVRSCNLDTHIENEGVSNGAGNGTTNGVTDFYDDKLCGTTNPLGRFINGVVSGFYTVSDPNGGPDLSVENACESSSANDPNSTDIQNSRFLHVEQNFDIRDDDGVADDYRYTLILNALLSEIPSANPIENEVSGNTDSDGDGILDAYDPFDDSIDGDSDGLPLGIDPDDGDDDIDGDGILDGVDYSINGTIFNGVDTNANGIKDSTETAVILKVEFTDANSADNESIGGNLPTLTVQGGISSSSQSIEINAADGTAQLAQNDYSFTNPTIINIPAGDYTTPQIISLSGLSIVDDLTVEGNEDFTLTLSNPTAELTIDDADNDTSTLSSTIYTISDDETAGVNITVTDNLTSEAGDQGSFSVVLSTAPTGDVVVSLASSNINEGTLSSTSLTFTTLNWSIPQQITVTGVDDVLSDGTQIYTVITDIDDVLTADTNYDNLVDGDIVDPSFQNQNDDAPAVLINVVDNETTEAGGRAELQFSLAAQPAGGHDIEVGLASSNSNEGTVQASIVIANANWNTPASNSITITGVDDAILDGSITFTINTTIISAPVGSGYETMVDNDIANPSITNLDDEQTISITALDANASENPVENGQFRLNLSAINSSGVPIVATLTIAGEAQNGTDYTNIANTISIPSGANVALIDLIPLDDADIEGYEEVIISISSTDAGNIVVDSTSATVVISDDEDTDGDGVSNAFEDAGFNAGDGNGDGIADSMQINVSGAPNPVTGAYSTLHSTGTCDFITENQFFAESAFSDDSDTTYPVGLADFTLDCDSAGQGSTIVIYYDQLYDTSSWTYRKYNSNTSTYSDISDLITFSTATVGGTPVTTVSFTVTDGDARTDEDGILNGEISDPSGPAIVTGGGGGGSTTYVSQGGGIHRTCTTPNIDQLQYNISTQSLNFNVQDFGSTGIWARDYTQALRENIKLSIESAEIEAIIPEGEAIDNLVQVSIKIDKELLNTDQNNTLTLEVSNDAAYFLDTTCETEVEISISQEEVQESDENSEVIEGVNEEEEELIKNSCELRLIPEVQSINSSELEKHTRGANDQTVIKKLIEKGLILKRDNLKLNEAISRAEVAKVVSLARQDTLNICSENSKLNKSSWYYDYMRNLVNNGAISGDINGDYAPERLINKAELSKILTLSFKEVSQKSSTINQDWYLPFTNAFNEFFEGRSNLVDADPSSKIKRIEFFSLIELLL